MSDNPFRRQPSETIPKFQEGNVWGDTKFVPKKFAKVGRKPFNKGDRGGTNAFNRKFDNRKGNNFHKKNDNYKFNQIARDAKPENATPWNKYKDEIIFSQREEEQALQQANINSNEAKNALKQREMNYRKSLIEQKKQEPTQWEDFGEETTTNDKKKKGFNKTKQNVKNPLSNAEDSKKKNFIKKHNKKSENQLNNQSKTKFKKKMSSSELKSDVKEFISKELLDNFDSKKLNYQQRDKLRSVITSTTTIALRRNRTIDRVVRELKYKKAKKERLENKY